MSVERRQSRDDRIVALDNFDERRFVVIVNLLDGDTVGEGLVRRRTSKDGDFETGSDKFFEDVFSKVTNASEDDGLDEGGGVGGGHDVSVEKAKSG